MIVTSHHDAVDWKMSHQSSFSLFCLHVQWCFDDFLKSTECQTSLAETNIATISLGLHSTENGCKNKAGLQFGIQTAQKNNIGLAALVASQCQFKDFCLKISKSFLFAGNPNLGKFKAGCDGGQHVLRKLHHSS